MTYLEILNYQAKSMVVLMRSYYDQRPFPHEFVTQLCEVKDMWWREYGRVHGERIIAEIDAYFAAKGGK